MSRGSVWGQRIEEALREHGPMKWSELKEELKCESPQLERGLRSLGRRVRKSEPEYSMANLETLALERIRGKVAVEGSYAVMYLPAKLHRFLKTKLRERSPMAGERARLEEWEGTREPETGELDEYDQAWYYLYKAQDAFDTWMKAQVKAWVKAHLPEDERELYNEYAQALREDDPEIRRGMKGERAAAGAKIWNKVEHKIGNKLKELEVEEINFLVLNQPVRLAEALEELRERVQKMDIEKLNVFARRIATVGAAFDDRGGEQEVADLIAREAGLTGPGTWSERGKVGSRFSHDAARNLYLVALNMVKEREGDLTPDAKGQLSRAFRQSINL